MGETIPKKPKLLYDVFPEDDVELVETRTMIGGVDVWAYVKGVGTVSVWEGDDGEFYVEDPFHELVWHDRAGNRQSLSIGPRNTVELSVEAFAALLVASGFEVDESTVRPF